MKQISLWLNRLLNITLVCSLALMTLLVFINVILRYFFNSGISWSEEIARFFFVWLIYLGAVGALKDNQHLGIDIFTHRLKGASKKVLVLIQNIIIVGLLWLIFDGSSKLVLLNLDTRTTATGMPYIYIYIAGNVMAVCMALVVIVKQVAIFFQKNTDESVQDQ